MIVLSRNVEARTSEVQKQNFSLNNLEFSFQGFLPINLDPVNRLLLFCLNTLNKKILK